MLEEDILDNDDAFDERSMEDLKAERSDNLIIMGAGSFILITLLFIAYSYFGLYIGSKTIGNDTPLFGVVITLLYSFYLMSIALSARGKKQKIISLVLSSTLILVLIGLLIYV